jgi:DNA replication protein DnaC
MDNAIRTVGLYLKALRLPAFGRHYEVQADTATTEGWSHARYLHALCELEIADRYQRRVHKWTREARLATEKTFSTLQLARIGKAERPMLAQLQQSVDWVLRADNVLLLGPSGTGKTHIAHALGHQLIAEGVRCKVFPAVALVQHLQQAKRELELMAAMSKLDKYRVIVIDDIGYVKKNNAETDVLFEFIAHRYESASLIITANQPFSEWDHIFPDSMMTVAAVDRLIHHASIIELKGESYRKQHYLSKNKPENSVTKTGQDS